MAETRSNELQQAQDSSTSLERGDELDQATLEGAKMQKEPRQRLEFFVNLTENMFKTNLPEQEHWQDRFAQSVGTLVSLEGIAEAYKKLFDKELAEDLPEIDYQLKAAPNKVEGYISKEQVIRVLDMGLKMLGNDFSRRFPQAEEIDVSQTQAQLKDRVSSDDR